MSSVEPRLGLPGRSDGMIDILEFPCQHLQEVLGPLPLRSLEEEIFESPFPQGPVRVDMDAWDLDRCRDVSEATDDRVPKGILDEGRVLGEWMVAEKVPRDPEET